MTKKPPSGFTPGVATGSTPSQGTGSHSPAADPAKRVITQATHPGVIVGPIPKAPAASKDGVVLTPRRETHQGWYRNEDVKQVEV